MQTKDKQISELTELNEELENYFANTIIPQLFVDANLVLRKYTPPAMKQFRLNKEHLGRRLEEIKENFRFPTIIENVKTVIATGKLLEKEIQTTDMSWYQMNILPYHVRAENRTNGVIITFVDITPRIRDLKEQERLIAEQALLLDTITHDIKNPLLAVGLTVEMLKRISQEKPQDVPKLLDNLEAGLTNIRRIVDDLADSRWKNEKYDAAEELIDLQNILEDVRLALAPTIAESGAVIKEQIGVSEVRFIRRKLRSVLYNLISNAIKYTPVDRVPEITIGSKRENEYMVISVADNGIGIGKEDQKKIFEKFKRIKDVGEGYGVGLYLVNSIVSSSGGKLEVESEPGKGSTFKVYLKLDSQKPPQKASAS